MRRVAAILLLAAALASCGKKGPEISFGALVPTEISREGGSYTVTLNGAIRIHGVTVRKGREGEFLKMPGRDRFSDIRLERGEGDRLAPAVKEGVTGTGGAALEVTGVEIRPHESGALKAFANVTFNDGLIILSAKVLEGRNGLFVGMPSKKVGEEWKETVEILDRALQSRVEEAVLAAYRRDAPAAGGPTAGGGGTEEGAGAEE